LVVQCKYQQSVSADVVIQLYGMAASENANLAVVITTGAFTMDAKKFAQEHSNIEIIDMDRLTGLTNRYLKHD
jgi:restriction endonuclease Mrr